MVESCCATSFFGFNEALATEESISSLWTRLRTRLRFGGSQEINMISGRNVMNRSLSIIVALIILTATAAAQEVPIIPNGRMIEGTWNLQIQWRTCDDGTPQLQPTPALISFAGGGVVTESDSSIWCDFGHCTSLGVWRHVAGRRYTATYKRARLDSAGNYSGYTIAVSSILHRPDDTLSITDRLTFYSPDGTAGSDRCRTAVGTRFTGEN